MPRLLLDFAGAQRNVSGARLGLGLALLVTGAGALGLAAWEYREQSVADAALRTQRDHLAERVQRHVRVRPISPDLAAQADQAGAAYDQVLIPWEEIFQALEASRGPNIALLSFTADAGKHEISLTGEAKDFASLSAFADTLSANPLFRKASLVNHKLSDGAPPVVVKFDLALGWRGPGGEAK